MSSHLRWNGQQASWKECRAREIPYFLKQLGASASQDGAVLELQDGHGGDWNEWPAELHVREVPQNGWLDPARYDRNLKTRGHQGHIGHEP